LIRQATPSFNFYNPVYGLVTPGTTVSAADSEQTDKLGTRGFFAQDTFHLTNWLSVVGGVRWMEYEQLAGKGRPNFVTNTNLAGDKVLPLGGVIFKLNDQLSYYVSYTQSLKPTSTIAPFAGAPIGFVVDSTILPEEGTQWETGVKFDVNKRLLALWRSTTSRRRTCWSPTLLLAARFWYERPQRRGRAASSWT
jgi:iron complex outermembrane receptor protein